MRAIVTIVVFLIFFFQLGLLCAQPLSMKTNELMAEVGVRSISAAIISYVEANKGEFPDDFLADLIDVEPPYLRSVYADEEKDGYRYSVEFYSDGYKIAATPAACGQTGNKVFILEVRGKEIDKVVQDEFAPADLEIEESICED